MADSSYTAVELLQPSQGDAAFRALMASPVSAPRRKLRNPRAPKVDAAPVALKSLAGIYLASPKGRRSKKSTLSAPVPTYAAWLRKCGVKGDAVTREVERAKAEWTARNAAELAEVIPLPIVEVVEEIELLALTA